MKDGIRVNGRGLASLSNPESFQEHNFVLINDGHRYARHARLLHALTDEAVNLMQQGTDRPVIGRAFRRLRAEIRNGTQQNKGEFVGESNCGRQMKGILLHPAYGGRGLDVCNQQGIGHARPLQGRAG